ncbi:MAG: hypothetical protein GDA43_03480 [Hormoscilla sp. SP5CHS1]|nr:hypothetical protein [Hormoscilla sp. SP12CHS1]MBC6452366.1 hypothetical protein [Hormoscilla sp. SP5CHS1]
MDISATGSGQFSIFRAAFAGTPTESLSRATVVVTNENYVAMSFRGKDNRLMRFSGQLVRRNANSLTVNFANYGKTKATGTLNVQYGANNSISSLNGNGTIDGQRFSINFNNSQSQAPQNQGQQNLNLSQNGRGRFSLAGENRLLTSARVVANPNGNVNISLRDRSADGPKNRQNQVISFRGQVMRRTADRLLVNLTDSGSFDGGADPDRRTGGAPTNSPGPVPRSGARGNTEVFTTNPSILTTLKLLEKLPSYQKILICPS